MSVGLSISRLISVSVILTPAAAQVANLNTLMIMGDSDIIDVTTRLRFYSSLAAVATDFGTSAPEYLAAALYFAQAPQPQNLYIGRWAQAATKGRLIGGILTPAQQLMSAWTSVTAGAFKIQVDAAGSPVNIGSLNFSGAANLNAVATLINTALTAASVGAVCAWNATYGEFTFTSNTTGTSSKVLPLTAGTSNDISAQLCGTVATGALESDGIAAESAVTAASILDGNGQPWYGLTVASTHVVDADHLAIAAYIEGSANRHIYGVSTAATTVLNPAVTSDIASSLQAAGYTRTFCQYSQVAYAAASLFGRFLTTNFQANNSTITLMYKQEPGVTAETLNAAQANAVDAKRCNVFVNYNNSTAIIETGVMSGPYYIDEIYGADWFSAQLQTDQYNALYTSPTKIPQTDAGNHILATVAQATCEAAVNNGLLGPGVWTATGFGQLKTGDTLPLGYYVYQPPIASQSPSDRAARKSVTFQIAAKLAGAIHSVNISVSVNR